MPTSYVSHCVGCPYASAKHLPPQDRATRAAPLSMENNGGTILLIFQAPGVVEWSSGHPVSSTAQGSAAMRLAAAFADCGKSRVNYNITNSVQCFPGKKEVSDGKRPRDKAPLAAARRQCANWLRLDIEAHEYERVVVFGSIAKQTIHSLTDLDTTSFIFLTHPSGGLSNAKLREALG